MDIDRENFFAAPTLANEWVTLEPLSGEHADALAAAVGDLHELWYQDHIPVSYTHLTLPTIYSV